MRMRWNSILVLVGFVLLVSALGIHTDRLSPHPVFATTIGCTPSTDLYACGVSGNTSQTGFGVTNNSTVSFGTGIAAVSSSPNSGQGGSFSATATSGNTKGVYGSASSTTGIGVRGDATASSGSNIGVHGVTGSSSGTGVRGQANTPGAFTYGVYGVANSSYGAGVYGVNSGTGSSYGVYGTSSSPTGVGVAGINTNTSNDSLLNIGVYGRSDAPDGNYAGYFDGNVQITGSLWTGGSGGFIMDHPLGPASKYLIHTSITAPNMMNIYSGNITTDANGNAEVTLPDYFEAINTDFRYQLTVVGQFAQAIVASEIKKNRFTIKTDRPLVKVSWQVTGIRNDPYAQQNPIQVVIDKPEHERGTYLHPKAYGEAETKRLEYLKRMQEPKYIPAPGE